MVPIAIANAAPVGVEMAGSGQPQGMIEDLIDAMLNGGVNRGLFIFVNVCFSLLLVFLLLLTATWGVNVHTVFMLILCIGLFASINWYAARTRTVSSFGLSTRANVGSVVRFCSFGQVCAPRACAVCLVRWLQSASSFLGHWRGR